MSDLIFGGNGFIGRHLCNYLKQNNPISFDIGLRAANLSILPHTFKHMDVRRPALLNLFDDIDDSTVIFNLAAIHVTPGHANREYFETNINGAENICEFANKSNITTIVFTSSISVYGPEEDLKTEDSLTMPTSAYGASKLTAEWIHRQWLAEDETRKLAVLRPGTVFGHGEGGNFSRLYYAMKKGLFIYPGRRDTLKACIYVKDLVRAMVEMANSNEKFQLFNMCYENPPTIEEICETIAEVTGLKPPKFSIPAPVLRSAAGIAYKGASIFGKEKLGIHPDRIDKLINSTNISGKKLENSTFKPKYTLRQAIEDWYEDCNRKGLY